MATQDKLGMNTDLSALPAIVKKVDKGEFLDAEEEKFLFYCVQDQPDKAAADKATELIVRSYQRFVSSVAKKYQGGQLLFEDLMSEGNLGLLKAIENFEAAKGYRFSSYAIWWVRQAIMKAVYEKGVIHLPQNRINDLIKLKKWREQNEMEASSLSLEEQAERAGVLVKGIREAVAASGDVASLDAAVPGSSSNSSGQGGSHSGSLIDFIPDKESKGPEQDYFNSLVKDDFAKAFSELDERDVRIIKSRFGLDGVPPVSLQTLALEFGISKERVRQIETRALKKLKDDVGLKFLFEVL